MSLIRQFNDLMLEIPRGNVTGITSVNKFGRSTNVDSGIKTDIWDRANTVDNQVIWVAPTAARIHDIVSTSASDDGDPVGAGARTIRIFGLTDWNSSETSEDIIMNGVNNVATSNSYVIIHRMEVLTKGSTSSNVGQITATAQVDGTITAQITIDKGLTQMAIYGIPSIQTAYMTSYYTSVLRASLASVAISVDLSVLYNPEPDVEMINFLSQHTAGITSYGSSPWQRTFKPYNKFDGPGILKLQVIGGTNNLDISGGFDLILVDN